MTKEHDFAVAQYVKLKLYVSNQVGVDSDFTYSYIEAGIKLANWTAPAGVVLDINAQTLSGEVNAAWSAYRQLAEAVSLGGHGVDFDGNEIDADAPVLTACPSDLICDYYTTAAQALSRYVSQEAKTWAQFKKLMCIYD